MTTVSLISDCHLNFSDLTLPGGDILVAAGDIMEVGHLRRADNAGKDTFIADRYRRFIREEFSKYREVIYVCGNHEHYNNDYEDTFVRLEKELPSNVHFLEADSVVIDDIHFFGGTFWTDMNKGNPITAEIVGTGMNDYRVIGFEHSVLIPTVSGGVRHTKKMHPYFTMKVFRETVSKLKIFLDEHVDDKVVVVSHHAPSPLSINETYKHEFHMNGGYCSDLTEFIMDHPQIKAWCHGHLHDPCDYMIGSTRVLLNPRGYKGYEKQAELFNPNFSFEV